MSADAEPAIRTTASEVFEEAEKRRAAVVALPPLAMLMLFGALGDLFCNDIFLPFVADGWPRSQRIDVARFTAIFPNIVAIAGATTFLLGTWQVVRMPAVPNYARLLISLSAGLFAPNVILSTFLPLGRVSMLLIMSSIATSIIVLLAFVVSTAKMRLPKTVRLAFVAMLLLQVSAALALVMTGPLWGQSSELLFFLAVTTLGIATAFAARTQFGFHIGLFAMTAVIVIAVIMFIRSHYVPEDVTLFFFTTLRLDAFAHTPLVYGLTLPVALAGLTSTNFTRGKWFQVGFAGWLLVLATARPTSLNSILLLVVSSLLLVRFSFATEQPNKIGDSTDETESLDQNIG